MTVVVVDGVVMSILQIIVTVKVGFGQSSIASTPLYTIETVVWSDPFLFVVDAEV